MPDWSGPRRIFAYEEAAALDSCARGSIAPQDVTGTWQGPIQLPDAGGRQLRTVIKVSRADDKLKTVIYSIDQGGQPITAGEFTVQGFTVGTAVCELNKIFMGWCYSGTAAIRHGPFDSAAVFYWVSIPAVSAVAGFIEPGESRFGKFRSEPPRQPNLRLRKGSRFRR